MSKRDGSKTNIGLDISLSSALRERVVTSKGFESRSENASAPPKSKGLGIWPGWSITQGTVLTE